MDNPFEDLNVYNQVRAYSAIKYKIEEKAYNIIMLTCDFVIPHIGAAEMEKHIKGLDDGTFNIEMKKVIADINSEEEFLEWVNLFLSHYYFVNDTKLARKLFKSPYKNHFNELVIRRNGEQVSKG